MASKATPTDLEATTPSRDETPPPKSARRAVTKAAPKATKAKAKTRSKAAPKAARGEEKPAASAEAEAEGEAREEADDDVMVGEIAGEGSDGEPRDVEVPEAKSSDAGLRSYDPMQAYLHEVRRHALLTPDEEHALAVRYAETGDVEAAARMVTANLRLVVKIAYEYRRAYRNLMDIIQEGNIGLMQAVKRYDPYRGVKLSSYAAWWIRAYILRFILNNWRLVKLGTTQVQRKLFFNLNKEKQRLASMGIDPTSSELARRLDVPENEVIDMDRRLSGGDVSLDAPLGDGDGKATTRMDLLPSSGASVDDALSGFELDDMVRERLAAFEQTLSGKDITIFRDRLVADDPATLQEIGERYGISRERVRQLEKRLQDKLRVYLQSELGEALQFH